MEIDLRSSVTISLLLIVSKKTGKKKVTFFGLAMAIIRSHINDVEIHNITMAKFTTFIEYLNIPIPINDTINDIGGYNDTLHYS